MPTVPYNGIIPTVGRPDDQYLLMAAAMMKDMGRFDEPVMEKDAIARFGRPNRKITEPYTVEQLKDVEKKMEGTQRFKDYESGDGKGEGLERPVKEQGL